MADQTFNCPKCQTLLVVDPATVPHFACPKCHAAIRLKKPAEPAGPARVIPAVRVEPATPAAAAPVSRPAEPAPRRPPPRDDDDDAPVRKKRRRRSSGDDKWVQPVITVGAIGLGLLLLVIVWSQVRTSVGEDSRPQASATSSNGSKAGQSFNNFDAPFDHTKDNPNYKGSLPPGRADDPNNKKELDPNNLADLKAATVYVKLRAGVGSGFVVKVEGGKCRIVTNKHVVAVADFSRLAKPDNDKKGDGPKKKKKKGDNPFEGFSGMIPSPDELFDLHRGVEKEADVVFNAGTPQQRKYLGKVVYVDPDADLAIVEVDGVANPPKPIQIVEQLDIRELQPIYALGFPFGDDYSARDVRTAVTVTTGKVISVRYGQNGVRDQVHFDAVINPGNSGGPLLDSERRLVGVNTWLNTEGHIGIAQAHTKVIELLKPHLGVMKFALRPLEAAGSAPIPVSIALSGDGVWKNVRFVYSQTRAGNPKDPLDGETGSVTADLQVKNGVAEGSVKLGALRQNRPLYCQAVGELTDGTVSRTRSRLASLRLAGLTEAGEVEDVGEDAAFLKKNAFRAPLPFEAFLRSVGVGSEVENRYVSNGGRFDSGLGLELEFPEDEDKPHVGAAFKKAEKGATAHAILYGCMPDPLEAYAGGSIAVHSEGLRGFRSSDLQQMVVDAMKEMLGAVQSDEPLQFGSTSGRILEIAPIEIFGGYDPDDPPALRIAFVADSGVIHLAGAFNRSRKALRDSADAKRLFESMKPTGKLGSPRLPKKTLLFAPP